MPAAKKKVADGTLAADDGKVWRRPMNEPKYAIATEMRKRDGAQNQDCGAAERLLMADGNFAYVAAIADGVSCCDRPREAASLAVSHFRRAIEDTSLSELADSSMRAGWLKSWNAALEEEVLHRANDGYSTFCALAVIPFTDESGYGVLSINVGDSSSFLVSREDSRCVSLKPSDGGRRNSSDDGLVRGVGLGHRDGPLMDMEWHTYPASFSGFFWVGCDGVFNYVAGSDLRDMCISGATPFRELPQRALDLSMDEGRRQGKRSLDNATAAVVGVNVDEGPVPRAAAVPVESNLDGRLMRRRPARIILIAVLCTLALLMIGTIASYLLFGCRRGAVRTSPETVAEPSPDGEAVTEVQKAERKAAKPAVQAAFPEKGNAAPVSVALPEIAPPAIGPARPSAPLSVQDGANPASAASASGGAPDTVSPPSEARRETAPSPSSPAIKALNAPKDQAK